MTLVPVSTPVLDSEIVQRSASPGTSDPPFKSATVLVTLGVMIGT